MIAIDLSRKVALVTGGSRGIGRAVAELLGRAGARVAVAYHRGEGAAGLAARQIETAGGEAKAFAADVSDPEEARRLVRDVLAAWGRLDILVVSAGIWEEDAPMEKRAGESRGPSRSAGSRSPPTWPDRCSFSSPTSPGTCRAKC